MEITSGRDSMKECMLAALATSITSSSDTSLKRAPYRILSAMLTSNNTGSWDTIPIWERSHLRFKSRKSTPSRVRDPCKGSYKRSRSDTTVDLPHPLGPTSAKVCPGFHRNTQTLKNWHIRTSGVGEMDWPDSNISFGLYLRCVIHCLLTVSIIDMNGSTTCTLIRIFLLWTLTSKSVTKQLHCKYEFGFRTGNSWGMGSTNMSFAFMECVNWARHYLHLTYWFKIKICRFCLCVQAILANL